MKYFLAVLFLVAAALGDDGCEFPKRFTAGYLMAGKAPSSSDATSIYGYRVIGTIAVDSLAKRFYTSWRTGSYAGKVWYFYDKGYMYEKPMYPEGKCRKYPLHAGTGMSPFKFPAGAVKVRTGYIANTDVVVDVYYYKQTKGGVTAEIYFTVTHDKCILVNAAYDANKFAYGTVSLFDVRLRVEGHMFELPADCASAESKSDEFNGKSSAGGPGIKMFL